MRNLNFLNVLTSHLEKLFENRQNYDFEIFLHSSKADTKAQVYKVHKTVIGAFCPLDLQHTPYLNLRGSPLAMEAILELMYLGQTQMNEMSADLRDVKNLLQQMSSPPDLWNLSKDKSIREDLGESDHWNFTKDKIGKEDLGQSTDKNIKADLGEFAKLEGENDSSAEISKNTFDQEIMDDFELMEPKVQIKEEKLIGHNLPIQDDEIDNSFDPENEEPFNRFDHLKSQDEDFEPDGDCEEFKPSVKKKSKKVKIVTKPRTEVTKLKASRKKKIFPEFFDNLKERSEEEILHLVNLTAKVREHSGKFERRANRIYTFLCPICDVKCKSVTLVKKHFAQAHTQYCPEDVEEIIVACALPKKFHNCEFCEGNPDFRLKGILTHHQKSVHAAELKKIRLEKLREESGFCEICAKDVKNLAMHTRAVHSILTKNPFKCQECDLETGVKGEMIRHAKTCHNIQEKAEQLASEYENPSLISREILVEMALRAILMRFLERKNRTGQHMNHVYDCSLCDDMISFKYRSAFFEHVHEVHPDFDPYKLWPFRQFRVEDFYLCKICGYHFENMDWLKRHLSERHPNADFAEVTRGQGEFNCQICKESFVLEENYLMHIRSHQGYKDFKCDQCDSAFSSRNRLVHHIDSCHKKVVCEYCSEVLTKSGYKNHVNTIHKGVKEAECKICNKTFTRKMGLIKHNLYKHSAKKPVSCDICGYGAINNHKLKLHVDTVHLGIKSKICKICGAGFSCTTNLKLHMRKNHQFD